MPTAGSSSPSTVSEQRLRSSPPTMTPSTTSPGRSLPSLTEQDLITALSVENIQATALARRDVGTVGGVAFTDPDGTMIHLVIPEQDRKPQSSRSGIAPLRLGHVAWSTPDPFATRTFYEEKLGFRWSDTIEDLFVFLRHGADHHSLNLVRNEHPGVIQHIAFELRDWAHVQNSSEELAMHRIPVEWGPGRHGAGSNVFTYHKSPLCIVELYVEMDRMSHPDQGFWDPRPWHFFSPHQPRRWAFSDFGSMNTYGPGVPASMRE